MHFVKMLVSLKMGDRNVEKGKSEDRVGSSVSSQTERVHKRS